jgi:hypothetical protein
MVLELSEQLALEGLRTVVFAQKPLTQEECDEFMASIDET